MPYGTANEDTNKLSGVQMMAVDVNTATKDDPLGLYGTVGWKAWYSAKILQQARGVRVGAQHRGLGDSTVRCRVT
jgi:N4-gp56 family major capsid protein